MLSTGLRVVTQTPTLDTNIYASGDQLGTIMEIEGAIRGSEAEFLGSMLRSIVIVDKDNEKIAMDLLFFSESVTPAANNAAFDLSDADLLKCIGHVSVAAGDYITADATGAPNALATVRNVNLPLKAVAGSSKVYVLAIIRGAPTYASVSDLVFKFLFEQL